MEFLDEKVEVCGFKCVACPYTDCIVDDSGRVPDELPIAEKLELVKQHYKDNYQKYGAKEPTYETRQEKEKKRQKRSEASRQQRLAYTRAYNRDKRRGARRDYATTNYEYVVSSDILELTKIILSLKDKDEMELLAWLDRDLVNGGLNND